MMYSTKGRQTKQYCRGESGDGSRHKEGRAKNSDEARPSNLHVQNSYQRNGVATGEGNDQVLKIFDFEIKSGKRQAFASTTKVYPLEVTEMSSTGHQRDVNTHCSKGDIQSQECLAKEENAITNGEVLEKEMKTEEQQQEAI